MAQITEITQTTSRGGSTSVDTTQTVTHGMVNTNAEGARTSTEATGAATGNRASAITGNDDAGFSISFSVPLLGGLNASGGSPPLDP